MNRCPYCGRYVYPSSSRHVFIGFGGAPLFWGFPGFGWGFGWGGHHGWRDQYY